jgi:alpha-glucosidase
VPPTLPPTGARTRWWRSAVIYQIYIRSFADGNGDGIGDIAGIRHRLPYLRDLGIDAIWITPWNPSPMADGGYDVADYRDIDATFGTLAEADALIAEAHQHGIRVIVDLVPNHTSDQHPWFRAALVTGPGSPERDRYLFRDGCGPDGSLPPSNWKSAFSGAAWSRIREPDGKPGQWYLHLFAPEQPDLNWANPEVRAEFDSVIRFWLDRGVDGFRIDVAHGLAKHPALPDLTEPDGELLMAAEHHRHPYWDVDTVHEIYRAWRELADSYGVERMFVAEAVVTSSDRLARYVRPDELHTAFNFEFLKCPWQADALRAVIDDSLAALRAVRAPATWVLSNHDETRHVTRFGRADTGVCIPRAEGHEPVDLQLGTRRARAAALFMLALPGSAYIYQGEELGLWEVEDLPADLLQDPTWQRSGRTVRGRDGCRVPLPWSGEAPPFGFGSPDSRPWLPQPAAWRHYTAAAEAGDPCSMLELYRAALQIRHEHAGFAAETLRWLPAPADVLVFERDPGLRCAVNLSTREFRLPASSRVLLASAPLVDNRLPSDAAGWFSPH